VLEVHAARADGLPVAEAHWRASVAVRQSQLAREQRVSAQFNQLAYGKQLGLLTQQLQRLPEGSAAAAMLRRLEALRARQAEGWAKRRAALQATEREALRRALDAVVYAMPTLPGGARRRRPGYLDDNDDELPIVRGERIALRRPGARDVRMRGGSLSADPLPH
jgi:hypothetical protein